MGCPSTWEGFACERPEPHPTRIYGVMTNLTAHVNAEYGWWDDEASQAVDTDG